MVPTDKMVPQSSQSITALLEDVLGCKWSWGILRAISNGTNRPGQMERSIVGISTKVLNERLKKLVAHGVIQKIEFNEKLPHVEYQFTPLGAQFLSILQQIELLEQAYTKMPPFHNP